MRGTSVALLKSMSRLAIRGSVVWLTLALAAGIANGCSTANRTAASPEHPYTNGAASTDEEEAMQPASLPLATAARKSSSEPSGMADAWLADDSQRSARSKNDEMSSTADSAGEPNCSMHAEETPRGIALVFSTKNDAPENTRARVRALAAELELQRDHAPDAQTAVPASFGTRQIAELMAQVVVAETPQGGRITISAKDPEKLDALRARVLWHMAAFLPDSRDKRGECPVVPRLAAEQREREI